MSFFSKRQGGETARSLKDEACADCTRRCSLLHGKNSLSLRVASFFKVMIGDGWKDSMPLPPKFARTVPGLENKKTQLIDSDGQSWEVLICKVGGCISFQRGWNAFVLAHGLRAGYFLWFEYIEPHFAVKIYNETACELVGFSGKNCHQSKRARTNSSPFDSKDSPCFIINEVPMKKKQCSGSRAAEEKCQSRGKASDKGKSPIIAENPFNSKTSLAKDTTGYTVKEARSDINKSQSQRKSPMVAENTFSVKNSHGKNGRPCTVDKGFLKGQFSGYRFDVDKRQSQGKANDMEKSRTVAENTFSFESIYGESLPTQKASCFEEPFYMIGRGLEDKQGDDKNPILDLSKFETRWNSSGVAGENIAAIKYERSPPVEVDEENLVDRVVPWSAPEKILKRAGSGNLVKIPNVRENTSSVDASPRSAVKSGLANKEDITVAVPLNTYGIQVNCKGHCSENVSKLVPDKRNCHGKTSKPPFWCSGVAGENIAAIKYERSPPVEVDEENLVDRVVPWSAPEMILKRAGSGNLVKIPNVCENTSSVDASPRSAVKSGLANKEDITVAVPLNTYGIQVNCKGHCSENVSRLVPDKRNCHGKTSKPPLAPSAARPIKIEKIYATRSSVNVKKCQVSPGLDNAHSKPLAQNDPVTRFQKEGHALIDSGKSLQQTVIGALKLPRFHVPKRQSGETMLKAKGEPTEIAKTEPKVTFKSQPVRITKTKPMAIVKSEHIETTPLQFGNYKEMLRGTGVVNAEPSDCSFGVSSLSTPTAFSVLVTRNLSYLELPARLPSTNKERHTMKRKVVYLRDPLTRLWPVLYHDRLEFKLLTIGWEAFCKANDIQLGDECIFEVENDPNHIYKVSVLGK